MSVGAAMQTCRKLGGTLIQDIDSEEQAFLQAKLHYLHRFQPTDAFYWLGLFRSVNLTTMDDKWQWTHGTLTVINSDIRLHFIETLSLKKWYSATVIIHKNLP